MKAQTARSPSSTTTVITGTPDELLLDDEELDDDELDDDELEDELDEELEDEDELDEELDEELGAGEVAPPQAINPRTSTSGTVILNISEPIFILA